MGQITWSDERCDDLRRMWADGLSCSQIAGELGHGLSRNAIIGKVTRLGLEKRGHAGPHMGRPRPRKQRSARTGSPTEARQAVRIRGGRAGGQRIDFISEIEPEKFKELPAEDIPIEQRRQLLDLRSNDCRFPYGDPGTVDFFFCGGEALTSSPYCSYHSRVAYQPGTLRPVNAWYAK